MDKSIFKKKYMIYIINVQTSRMGFTNLTKLSSISRIHYVILTKLRAINRMHYVILNKLRTMNRMHYVILTKLRAINRMHYVILTKLRFENSPNKKTLKLAWRFFFSDYLFVTPAGFKPATLRAEI